MNKSTLRITSLWHFCQEGSLSLEHAQRALVRVAETGEAAGFLSISRTDSHR